MPLQGYPHLRRNPLCHPPLLKRLGTVLCCGGGGQPAGQAQPVSGHCLVMMCPDSLSNTQYNNDLDPDARDYTNAYTAIGVDEIPFSGFLPDRLLFDNELTIRIGNLVNSTNLPADHEQVLTLVGHDSYGANAGEFRVFNHEYHREIMAAARAHVNDSEGFQELLQINSGTWLLANPLLTTLQAWQVAVTNAGCNPTLTVLLDTCRSGAAVERFEQMRAQLEQQGRRVAVFAAAAADRNAQGPWFVDLLTGRQSAQLNRHILEQQRPCYAATAAYNSAVFEAVDYVVDA